MDTAELTKRALEIIKGKPLDLTDMEENGYYDPEPDGDDGHFPDDEARRFMVYQTTGDESGGWVHFFDKREDAAQAIADLAWSDDWGIHSVYDLGRDAYATPLEFRVSAIIFGRD